MSVADLTKLEISDDEIPTVPDAPDAPSIGDSDVSHCRVCGKGIDNLYSGKGRRPVVCLEHKTQTATKIGTGRGSGDVNQAVASLEQGYNMLVLALTLVGAQTAASDLAASIGTMNERNRGFLAQDKDLVKAINKVGKAGGRFGFYAAQAMLIGPVAVTAFGELTENRAKVADQEATDAPFAGFADESND